MGIIVDTAVEWKWSVAQGAPWELDLTWVDDDGNLDPANMPTEWLAQVRTGEARVADGDLIAEFDVTFPAPAGTIHFDMADTYSHGYGCWWYEIGYNEADDGPPVWQPVLKGPFIVEPSSLAVPEGS